ncbi:MAG: cation transporter [Emcibacter sp.]|nr:cation transporter [Emcibacter sp.]
MNKTIILAILFFAGLTHGARAEIVSTTLLVESMTCVACPYIVRQALDAVEGIQTISINKQKKTAAVTFDDRKTSIAELTKAIGDVGYPSRVKNN